MITLDMIHDICSAEGSLAFYADRIVKNQVIKKINQITHWARKQNYLIIHVRLGFRSDYLDGSFISPIFTKAQEHKAAIVAKWGGQFCQGLQIDNQDIQIIKHRVSAFYATDLELILRANDVKEIVLVGVSTNNAVELTAREAHDRDFKIQIIEDATECANDEEKAASLRFLARIGNVLTTQNLLQST